MIKIGLTGNICSGKSTISNIFKELNIPIIDCDIIARNVLNIYPEILLQIKQNFGIKFIDNNGNLIRKDFGDYIFKNKSKKKQYEDIILPYIKIEILKQINQLLVKNIKLCIVDAPLLIETELYKEMNKNILVFIDKNIQINRLMNRNNYSKQEALNRINVQMSVGEKIKYVDIIIDNNGTLDELRGKVYNIINNMGE